MDLAGSNLIRLDQIESDWKKLDQIGPDWTRLDQIGPDWTRCLEDDLRMTKEYRGQL